jgi:hypothetical protein
LSSVGISFQLLPRLSLSLRLTRVVVHFFFSSRIGQTKKVTIIKLVSKDTVDEDIYAMQQRKSKMNAAIMGSDAEWNKQTKEDKKQMLETAVSRFLKSPSTNNNPSQPAVAEAASLHKENSQNKDDFEEGTGEYL